MENSISSSLCRYRIDDEELVADVKVKAEVQRAFETGRAYEFYLDKDLITRLKAGDPVEFFRDNFLDIRNKIFSSIAKDDQTVLSRLQNDIRLSVRLISAMAIIHKAIAGGDYSSIIDRRFVIIKELPGKPTIYYISNETTVISHVGAGPEWQEIPTLYLGLKTFDSIVADQKKNSTRMFDAFKILLMIEERAIETGYNHSAVYTADIFQAINFLVDEVIRNSAQFEVDESQKEVKPKPEKKFTEKNRENFLRDIDAREKGNELDFNYDKNLKALMSLERSAGRYKAGNDRESLREIIRLLIAAAGHDIHEVRNRANIILERLLAPKEYDAPLATRFITLHMGNSYLFEFDLPNGHNTYFLRLYKNETNETYFLEKDIVFEDVPLVLNKDNNLFSAEYKFSNYGHIDFAVIVKNQKKTNWVTESGTAGRINVIPDVQGEVILEIFADIHGHTKSYWGDSEGRTGLLYNENGQVIRLGKFSDITAHLEDIKSKYFISSIYLLGVQKRGSNREDWAPEASSPSPFSPMSLVEIEPFLGGEKEFIELVKKAHTLDIKIIVDIVPHLNRKSTELPDDCAVLTYDESGHLTARASTDGRYGSWNDGKLLNYRKIAVWEWLSNSISELIERYDIDGIRFDSAHAVPIVMKKNNYPFVYKDKRTHEDMLEGNIIVNEKESDHFVTTGYYDSACRDLIAVPIHYYLMLNIERKLKEKKKDFFINIAECFWGHERFLTRTGLIPYNASLFKICENVIHGKGDVREIYHIYDNYFPSVLSEGTELLGILGNHDERRALNTFGHRGLRAATALTIFMSNIVMDYEGNAEGEGWKVFLDNIYVNWNLFEYAAHRSLEYFYRDWFKFHRENRGRGYLVWANNNITAAALKFTDKVIWLGAFNFAESNQNISVQFDNPALPIKDDDYFRLLDPLYSTVTKQWTHYTGKELKASRVNSIVSYTERVKLLKFERVSLEENYQRFLLDSFLRLCEMSNVSSMTANFSFNEISRNASTYKEISNFIKKNLMTVMWENNKEMLVLGLKRAFFHLYKSRIINEEKIIQYLKSLKDEKDEEIKKIGEILVEHNKQGSLVFMSAEAEPFSKSGGLANVVYELPRELVLLGEKVFVISGYYRNGDDKSVRMMQEAVKKYNLQYTGKTVRIKIMDADYEIGVHSADVEGVKYFLLDHYEFFDGLYWGITSSEKLRRRIAFARACAEVILTFQLGPHYTFTNDAYIGIFNGIIRSDPYYANHPVFMRNKFLHIVHNGGWQYFDSYERYENGFDLFNLFNLPSWRYKDFTDPVFDSRFNCMATGIRFSDKTITVSPSYAKQLEYASDGLERVVHDVLGISNAIGRDFRKKIDARFNASGFVDENYPVLLERIESDEILKSKIETRYPEILSGNDRINKIKDDSRKYIVSRMRNKLLLQTQRGLDVDPDIIIFSMIHRISEQKGFQLLLEASEGLIKNFGYQIIVGGAVSSGDRKGEELAHGLYMLSRYFPKSVNVNFGFQDVSIPLLATDLFGMPSMHEPGGISQLEAFTSGSLVVARATGGLRDTVFPIRLRGDSIDGNGFLFTDYSAWSFYDAMNRAASFFKENNDETIYKARINAENSVYYWDKPARKYAEEIYNMTETIRILD